MKPIDIVQIREVVERAIQSKQSARYHNERLGVLLENESVSARKKIVLNSLQGFEVISIVGIIRCQADRNYTEFYFKKGPRYVTGRTLKEFQFMLEEHGFFQIHQSHLINLHEVEEFSKVGRGGMVRLKDGSEVEVARRKRSEFLEKMQSTIDASQDSA